MSAHLQAPSTKTTSRLAVEVEGQGLWLSGGKTVSVVMKILGNSRSQKQQKRFWVDILTSEENQRKYFRHE